MQRQPPQQLTGWGWMQKLTPQETMTNSWLGRSTRELTTLRRSAQVAPARGDAGLTLDLPPSLTAHAMRTAVRPRYVHVSLSCKAGRDWGGRTTKRFVCSCGCPLAISLSPLPHAAFPSRSPSLFRST